MFQTISSEEELQKFADKTEEKLKIRYPMDYLKRSKVRAMISKNGDIVGGYIFAVQGPFRVVESLPKDVEHPQLSKDSLENGFEITGLWLCRKVSSRRQNFRFWTQLYIDIVSSKKKYFYYAYTLDKKCLADIYALTKPSVIFQGKTKLMPGMDGPDVESVEVASVKYVKWALLHKGDFLFKKLVLSRALSNKYFYAFVPALKSRFVDFMPKRKHEAA